MGSVILTGIQVLGLGQLSQCPRAFVKLNLGIIFVAKLVFRVLTQEDQTEYCQRRRRYTCRLSYPMREHSVELSR
jgi:hypothetical protein